MLPYGRQSVHESDVAAVATVLRGDWLTTGPAIEAFEAGLRGVTGASDVVAMSSGTAALHVACATLDLEPGDEVIVPSLTFAASANAVVYCGGTPIFAEVSPETFCLDPADVRRRLTPRTRAIITVHYAGLVSQLAELRAIASAEGLTLVEDAAHALGARDGQDPVGRRSRLATLSFHPVKHVTTGEGGAVATDSAELGARMRRLRNHGLDTDIRARERSGTWRYEMVELGWNYRLSDIGAALGCAQLERLEGGLKRRRELARSYIDRLSEIPALQTQRVADADAHAWHFFPIALRREALSIERDGFLSALRAEGIGANVHYAATHLQPFYRERFGHRSGELPVTEDVTSRLISLPLFPGMTRRDQEDVVAAVTKISRWYAV